MSNTPSDDLYWRLHGLSKILESSGFIDESRHPDAYSTILDAMAFVRGQQPVVREPLTDEQIVEAFCQQPHPVQFVSAFSQGVRFAERRHGITQKGGSNAE